MRQMDPALIARCRAMAEKADVSAHPVPTSVSGLSVVTARAETVIAPIVYEPMVCLVLQGAKEILHHGRAVRFHAGETVVVSHEVISGARIVQASAAQPYVALACRVDVALLQSLSGELDPDEVAAARQQAVAADAADAGVVDALVRMLDLDGKPLERRVLDPLVRRELHFRLLLTRNGGMLRQLARPGSTASRISRVLAHIRHHWNRPLRAGELAAIAGMSGSSFHEHFREVTATSPIQYQKSLRLIEARRRLEETGDSVSAIAFAVGYESPTQFSRDFRRVYGAAPRQVRPERGGPERVEAARVGQ